MVEKAKAWWAPPQGSQLSPILANIYLHALDEFVETLRIHFEKGKRKHRNPRYRKLADQKSRLARQGRTKTKEFRQVSQAMRTIPSSQVNDREFIRIKYLRFADDWIVGVWGNHALAEALKQDIQTFTTNSASR